MHYIIANWKSHKTAAEAEEWLTAFAAQQMSIANETEVIVAAPFSLLAAVASALKVPALSHLKLAVQDISPFPAGAYTGAVSVRNLAGFGVEYAILGHSERRRYFHETHQEIANKIDQCLSAGITPIVCVDNEYIVEQAAAIPDEHRSQCLVAYEDLAAIGTGNNTALAEVLEQFKIIKAAFGEVPTIYGGSVNGSNTKEYLAHSDGVLVGTASLKVEDFLAVINAA